MNSQIQLMLEHYDCSSVNGQKNNITANAILQKQLFFIRGT